MAIIKRLVKGSALTHAELDGNFTDLEGQVAARQLASEKGTANGYAGLDGSGKVPSAQLPSFVDDVIEAANFAALPGTGETSKIYVTLNDNKSFRWSGSAYVEISASPGSTDAVTEGSTNLYFTAARVRAAVLTGLGTVTAAAIAATDTVLQAFEKLQAQVSGKLSADLATAITTAKTAFSNTDKGILLDAAASDAPKTFTGAVMRTQPQAALGTSGTVDLNLAALTGTIQTIAATGAVTITTSNLAAGRSMELRIDANGGTRTLTWPAWVAYGAALPTSLASGKVLRVAISCTGTTDGSIDATSALSV